MEGESSPVEDDDALARKDEIASYTGREQKGRHREFLDDGSLVLPDGRDCSDNRNQRDGLALTGTETLEGGETFWGR